MKSREIPIKSPIKSSIVYKSISLKLDGNEFFKFHK